MDRNTFLQGMEFCRKHQNCPKVCPIYDQCRGAFDMLPAAFEYIQELTKENEKLRKSKDIKKV